MTDTVIELAEQFKRALIAKDMAAEKRLINAYSGLYARVRDLADALVLEIAGSEEMTPAQVQRMKRFGELMTRINDEMKDYTAFSRVEMSTAAREAIRMGEGNARALIGTSLGDAALAGKFNALNPAVIEKLLGFLDPSGPLYDKLSKLGGWTADQVSQAIIEGVGLGKNPKTTAAMLTKTLKDGITDRLGMGLTDSLRMMRTVQLYSYREANRASYVANGDVVKGWIWYADLSGACPSCVAMHGTEHPLTETLDDHHNGRCLTPETLVSGLMPDAVVTRHYDGEVFAIRTASGKLLTVTPNHPVLTDCGWVAANLLKKGDNVVGYSGGDWTSLGVNPDEYLMPTRVEDVFCSPRMDGFTSVPTTAEDFHGDGKGSDIHIIRANRFLLDKLDAALGKPLTQKIFSRRNINKSTFSGKRNFMAMLRGVFDANSAILRDFYTAQLFGSRQELGKEGVGGLHVSRLNSLRDQPRVNRASGNTESNGDAIDTFASVEAGDNIANRQGKHIAPFLSGLVPGDDIPDGFVSEQPIALEIIRQSLLAGMPTGGANLDAIARSIVFDSVVEISSRSFSGHVYNLQTKTGWYIADSIITHNCTMLPLVIGAKNDIQSGADWFEKQSEQYQRQALGETKFDAWKNGAFQFGDLSTTRQDDVYGQMRTTAPLWELLGSEPPARTR